MLNSTRVNSYLSDEELYQEARRINIAQYQETQ